MTRNYENSVGEGWKPIVSKAIKELEALGARIDQVKEKFGGLRLYYHMEPDGDHTYLKTDRIVDAAEAQCAITCEVCGEPGKIRHGGWIKTLCDKHEAERQAAYIERDTRYKEYRAKYGK